MRFGQKSHHYDYGISVETSEFVSKKEEIRNSQYTQHLYNFECNLRDDHGNRDGILTTQIPNYVSYSTTGGVLNLGQALVINKLATSTPGSGESPFQPWSEGSAYHPAVSLGESFNVNPYCFAISLWFNPNLVKNEMLFSKSNSFGRQDTVVSGSIINSDESPNSIRFALTTEVFSEITSDSNVFELNKWYHVVFWYNGTEMRIYLNGEVIATSNNENHLTLGEVPQGNVVQNSTIAAIGSLPPRAGESSVPSDGYRVFSGSLDQVVIWNCSINSNIILELYNNGNGTKIITERHIAQVGFRTAAELCTVNITARLTTESLCDDFCSNLEVLLTDCKTGECVRNLVKPINNMLSWPGKVDILNRETISSGLNRSGDTYTIQLVLDYSNCPLDLTGDVLEVIVNDCGGVFDLTGGSRVQLTGRCIEELSYEKHHSPYYSSYYSRDHSSHQYECGCYECTNYTDISSSTAIDVRPQRKIKITKRYNSHYLK